mgnify:FL=1
MGGKFKIKKQQPIASPVGRTPAKVVFGFSELKDISYTNGDKDGKFFIKFLGRLKQLSQLDWDAVNVSAKHSFGWEVMEVKSMTKSAQQSVPAGMDKLLVFRATGDNHVFLGYRQQNTFEVIFIEYNFGDIYSHG